MEETGLFFVMLLQYDSIFVSKKHRGRRSKLGGLARIGKSENKTSCEGMSGLLACSHARQITNMQVVRKLDSYGFPQITGKPHVHLLDVFVLYRYGVLPTQTCQLGFRASCGKLWRWRRVIFTSGSK